MMEMQSNDILWVHRRMRIARDLHSTEYSSLRHSCQPLAYMYSIPLREPTQYATRYRVLARPFLFFFLNEPRGEAPPSIDAFSASSSSMSRCAHASASASSPGRTHELPSDCDVS